MGEINGETRRRTVRLPVGADDRLIELAAARHINVNDAMRLAVGLLDAAERARQSGEYLGTTPVRENLQTVLVTPL